MSDLAKPRFPHLNKTNYNDWVHDIRGELMEKKVWTLMKGVRPQPPPSQSAELEKWIEDKYVAAGAIYSSLSPSQKEHVKDSQEDPFKMWTILEEKHLLRKPVNRFNAYDEFFSIRKTADETLTEVAERISKAITKIRNFVLPSLILISLTRRSRPWL